MNSCLSKGYEDVTSIPVLPANPTLEQLKAALKTKKPDCSALLANYQCGQNDIPSVPSGDIIQPNVGDEIAINSIAFEIVDLDGSGNGRGIVKVPMFNNAKFGVKFENIKVAKGGCVVSGQAILSDVDVALLSEEQRKKLAETYATFNKVLAIADSLAPEIAQTYNSVADFVEKFKQDISNYVGGAKDAIKMKQAFKAAEKYAKILMNDPDVSDSTRAELKAAYEAALETKDFFCSGKSCQEGKGTPENKKGGGPYFAFDDYEDPLPLCQQNKKKLDRSTNATKKAADEKADKKGKVETKPCDAISKPLNQLIVKTSSGNPLPFTAEILGSFAEFPKMCITERLKLINNFKKSAVGVPEGSENIIIEAIRTTPKTDIVLLFEGISPFLGEIYNSIDDKHFGIGKDNFTKLRVELTKLYNQVCDVQCIKKKGINKKNKSDNLIYGFRGGEFNNIGVSFTSGKITFSIAVQVLVGGLVKTISVKPTSALKPFEDVVNIVVVKNVKGIFGSIASEKIIPIPAYLLAWMVVKENVNTLTEVTEVTADLVSLAFGAGELKTAYGLYSATRNVKNLAKIGLAIAEVVPSGSRILLGTTGLREHILKTYGDDGKGILENYDLVVNSMDIVTGLDAAFSFCKLFRKNKAKLASDGKLTGDYDELAIQERKMEEACEQEGLCFVASTLVLTQTGKKPIEKVQKGEKVLAKDPLTGEIAYKTVLQTVQKNTLKLVRIVAGSDTIFATPTHPFYTNNGWTEAQDLRKGVKLTTANAEVATNQKTYLPRSEIEVDDVAEIDSTAKVYNFEVDDFHTYFVGNEEILVHNGEKCFDEIGSSLISFSNFRNDINKATKKFHELFFCVEYAAELKKLILKNGKLYDIKKAIHIKLKIPKDSYFSTDIISLNGKNISTNAYHEAFEIDGYIFDNINPAGIEKQTWLNGLERALKLPNGKLGTGNYKTFNLDEIIINF